MNELERLYKACGYTCAGLAAAWRHERSFRAEVVAAAVLVPIACIAATTLLEAALLIGSVLLVLIVELLNSAIESAIDRISLERHELSKRAKDTGSAAVALTIGLAVLVWGAILAPRVAAAAPPPAFADAHVHLNDVAMQLALMDEYGVERAVVFWGRKSDDESVLAASALHPGRFVPFASISPERTRYRPFWERDDPAILERLAALLATGRFRGIGEISVVHDATPGFAATGFALSSKVMRGILDLAREHRMPVMVHCEARAAAELSALLAAYPGVAVIWAHGGYTDAATAREMLERHPNLYYELSARTWPRHPRSAAYSIAPDGALRAEWRALVEAMPARFLVGSDASHHSEASERMKLASVRAFLEQLSAEARREVGGGTLRRLLGE